MSDGSRPIRQRHIEQILLIGSMIAAITVVGVIGIALWQYRQETLARAQLLDRNLMLGIESAISQRIQGYDAALDLVVTDWPADPSQSSLAPWQGILTTLARSTGYAQNIQILDREGRVVAASSHPPPLSAPSASELIDWHRTNDSSAIHIGSPQRSGRSPDEWTLTLSRPRFDSAGAFAGIAVITVQLEFLRAILRQMDIGPEDTATVVTDGGQILMRRPAVDGLGDVGRDISSNPNFRRAIDVTAGSFTAVASLDHIERLYNFSRIPGTNLIVSVGLASEPIFSTWRWRSIPIASVAVAVSIALVIFALLLRRELRLRTAAEHELQRQAMTDFLTGLPNRRRFDDIIQREWRRAARTQKPLSLLLIDADHFKQINDGHGHAVGDEVLKRLACVLNECGRRPGDSTARIGGEEFAMVLPDTPLAGAIFVAENVRARLASAPGAGLPDITVSIGAAAMEGEAARSAEALREAADAALYAAKRKGRDRVDAGGTKNDMHPSHA